VSLFVFSFFMVHQSRIEQDFDPQADHGLVYCTLHDLPGPLIS
jgi:hypothetical protein